jgi:1-acyl-sn-glycerol-3-phosphate acyltransferase
MTARKQSKMPVSKKWLVDGFLRFTRRMVAKQFISFGIQRELLDLSGIDEQTPIVVYANHASWWDPICAMQIRHHAFPSRIFYAPIDADALANYRIMAKLGFYGLRLKTSSGASEFLAMTKLILESQNAAIFITPEGRFTDVRDYSVPLMPGLAHLASKSNQVAFIPMALEYAFWDESRPQMFARLGAAMVSGGDTAPCSKSEWNELLTRRLRQTQSELADSVISRDAGRFEHIIASRPIRLGWYDYFRSWASRMEGKRFDPRHGSNKQ